MKKLFFLAAAASVVFACSKSDQPPSDESGGVVFEVSAANRLDDGITKTPVYSQEAVQHVTRVTIYAFKASGSDYLFAKSYSVSGWSDGLSFKRFAVPENDKLSAGNYKFLAVGQNASDLFTVTSPTSSTKFDDMVATIAAPGNESEIFAGSSNAEVLSQGTRVFITMTRHIAGVLGYFKNVPQNLDGKTVQYLKLSINNADKQVNLTTGVGSVPTSAAYTLMSIDLSGQSVVNGIYTGNDLSAAGVQKIANSQLGGAYVMPVGGITMTLGLYDNTNAVIRSWTVYDGGNASFDLLANHFYSLGRKVQTSTTTGGTSDPADDDDAIDLLVDQSIAITISPAWTAIDNLTIQPTVNP